MSYHGDIRLGDTIDIKFTTRRFSTGAPFTLAGTPAVSAYVGNGTTEITAGITLTVDFDARTGLNNVRVVASSGNGFATATNVQLVITAGTVDSVSVVGEVIGEFSIENRSAVMPTTAGRTLDVSAGGEAGVDWANVGSPTTTVGLTNTTVGIVTTVTNQLTAAQIASGVWQDATAGDFTVASSIGKTLYIANVVPGGSGGLMISGTNSGTVTFGALTVSGATILTGAVSLGSTLGITGAITATNASNNLTLGTFTVTTNAMTWNAAWDAEAQSEVNDGLVAFFTSSAALVDAIWDEDATAHQAQGTFGQTIGDSVADSLSIYTQVSVLRNSITATTATVNDAGATTTVFNTTLTEANDFWNDALLTFTSGALNGQTIPIADFANLNGQVTLSEAATSAPENGVSFTILRTHVHPTTQIASSVWTAAARTLTALDEDNTTLDLDATIRAGVGLAAANLDTQLADIPTVAEFEARTLVAAAYAEPGDSMALTAAAVDAILDDVVAGSTTLRQALRGFIAALLGKVSGLPAAPKFRDIADTKNVIDATTDADGNRTAVTLDLT